MITRGETMLATTGTILSSGYTTLDVILDGTEIGHRAGGTAANVAANLAFFGWEAHLAAVIGTDPAGKHLASDLVRAGVGTSHLVRQPDATTPVVIHEILSASHRFRFGCPVCGRRFPRHRPVPPDHAIQIGASVEADVFFFDRVSLGTLEIAARVRERGGLVVFEPATRGRADQFEAALNHAHIVKLSKERMHAFEDRLSPPKGRQVQVLTNGGQGAAWRVGGTRWRSVPGFRASVVDAGGAGDWTTAAMLTAIPSLQPAELLEVDFAQVLKVSQAVGALSCGAAGARGISQVMTRAALIAAVEQLLGDLSPSSPPVNSLRRSRRGAACSACLAGAI